MLLVVRRLLLLPTLALLAMLAPAAAAGPPRVFVELDEPGSAAPEPGTPAVCRAGETRPSNINLGGFVTPGLVFFTRLAPDSCAECGGEPVRITAAGIRLRAIVACSIALRVSIVAAAGTPECPRPDSSNVLCAAESFTVPIPAGRPSHEFLLPLVSPSCVRLPAFLEIQVVATDCGYPDPLIGSTGFPSPELCVACLQWMPAADAPGDLVDICDEPQSIGLNLLMWAEAECCAATPTRPASWGAIKTRYR